MIVLTTTTDDDGIWLECNLCHQYRISLGDDVNPNIALTQANAAEVEHQCET